MILSFAGSFTLAIIALVLVGAGLAGGFPIMLGIVGNLYRDIAGTAFSFILVIALLGNILVNYAMAIIAQQFGIQHVVTAAFVEIFVMFVLFLFIRRTQFKYSK